MAYGVVTGQVPEVELPPIPESFPIGGIIIWSGASTAIPSGWHLCDGRRETPDLRNRFIVGAGSEYKVGDTGGSNEVTLTVEQMPSHSHDTPLTTDDLRAGKQSVYVDGQKPYNTLMTKETGGSQPHENRPPYYALCYIMKIK
jgi:microcystin-dependent protein